MTACLQQKLLQVYSPLQHKKQFLRVSVSTKPHEQQFPNAYVCRSLPLHATSIALTTFELSRPAPPRLVLRACGRRKKPRQRRSQLHEARLTWTAPVLAGPGVRRRGCRHGRKRSPEAGVGVRPASPLAIPISRAPVYCGPPSSRCLPSSGKGREGSRGGGACRIGEEGLFNVSRARRVPIKL